MAISLNSVLRFNSTFQTKHQDVSRYSCEAAVSKLPKSTSNLHLYGSAMNLKERRWLLSRSVSENNWLSAEPDDTGAGTDSLYALNPNPSDSSGNHTSKNSSNVNQDSASSPKVQSTSKRASLTARERLRAARVLSRYTDTEASDKPKTGSKLLDVLKESDKGKKKGLPEAPTNLFDDSKRGLPKPGLTFNIPGASDLLLIAFSAVFISTVMFTTTYIVWKAGAIHFNEY